MKKQRKNLIIVMMVFVMMMLMGFTTYGSPKYQEYKENNLVSYLQGEYIILNRMTKDMEGIPPTGDPSIDYLYAMTIHHQGAVDISKTLLKYGGQNKKIKRIAEDIIENQSAEIEEMDKLIDKLEGSLSINKDKEEKYLRKYNRVFEESKLRDKSKPISADQVFAKDMIKHDETAIEISKLILKYTDDDEVEYMAKKIIEKQSEEIEELKDVLKNMK